MAHDKKVRAEIIGKAMVGESVAVAAREANVPARTAYHWVEQYKSAHPDEWLEANDALSNLATIAAFEGLEQTRERNEQYKNLDKYNMLRGTAIDKKQRHESPESTSAPVQVFIGFQK